MLQAVLALVVSVASARDAVVLVAALAVETLPRDSCNDTSTQHMVLLRERCKPLGAISNPSGQSVA